MYIEKYMGFSASGHSLDGFILSQVVIDRLDHDSSSQGFEPYSSSFICGVVVLCYDVLGQQGIHYIVYPYPVEFYHVIGKYRSSILVPVENAYIGIYAAAYECIFYFSIQDAVAIVEHGVGNIGSRML